MGTLAPTSPIPNLPPEVFREACNDALRDTRPSVRRAIGVAFLLLALLFHLLVLRVHVPWTGAPSIAPVEVVQVDPSKLDAIKKQWQREHERSLLLDQNPNAKSDTPPPDARYFSDRNIRVEKEQRAKSSDVMPHPEEHTKTREKPSLGNLGVPLHLARRAPADPVAPLNKDSPGADLENSMARDQRLLDKSLPEGGENLLNAQESVFYSFYARLYESIGPIWQSDLRSTHPDRKLQPGDYQTVVDVVLDHEGNLVAVRLLQSSGVAAFDEAVHRSWKKIPRFPNPPKGLLDATGHVHMGWSFTVQIDTNFGLQYLPPERQG